MDENKEDSAATLFDQGHSLSLICLEDVIKDIKWTSSFRTYSVNSIPFTSALCSSKKPLIMGTVYCIVQAESPFSVLFRTKEKTEKAIFILTLDGTHVHQLHMS